MMRLQLNYSNVMATVAVCLAFGGTSYAAIKLPANSVGDRQIKRDAVGGRAIKSGAVGTAEIKNGSLIARDFLPSQLPRGAQGPRGHRGERGPSEAYTAGGDGSAPSLPPDGTWITVASVGLPPGHYVFTAEVVAGNRFATATRLVRCELRANGTSITDADRSVTLEPDPTGATSDIVTVHDFRSLTQPTVVKLQCSGANVGEAVQAAIFDPVLTAINVGALR